MTSQSNKADALIYMLHQIHGKFGDKPQVGKLFQSRDGSSLATFFTLMAKNMGGSPVTGLLIITQHGNGVPQMGILYDDSRRFVEDRTRYAEGSLRRMAGSGIACAVAGSVDAFAGAGCACSQERRPERLYPATGGDRSAVISLPPGWRIISVAGGSIVSRGYARRDGEPAVCLSADHRSA